MALNDLRLTFRDEFNSLSLDTGTTATDPNFWNSSMHNGYVRSLSGNKELQIYADPDYKGLGVNPFSVNDGILSIKAPPASTAVKNATGYGYTSGVLTSQGAFSQQYGYFEVRAQVPEGQGLWPAFWLLNDDENWPPELDVMEVIGSETKVLHQSVHTDHPDTTKVTYLPEKLSAGFHTYGMDWTKSNITFYLDGKVTGTVATPSDIHGSMYMVLNLAVGGTWPGSPNATTNFATAKLNVDYVRVYQHGGSGGVLPVGGSTTTPAPTTPAPTTPTPVPQPGLVIPTFNSQTSMPSALLTPDAAFKSWPPAHVKISNGGTVSVTDGSSARLFEHAAGTSKTYAANQLNLQGTPAGATVSASYDAQKNITIVNNGAWGGIDNAAVRSGVMSVMTVKNFAGVEIDNGRSQGATVNVSDVMRGSIATSGGNDSLQITGKSNATTGNLLTISAGNGNNSVSYSGGASNRAAIITGSGADTVTFGGQANGAINTGAGNDRVNVRSTGNLAVTGGAGADVFSFIAGAHATIADFKAGEDRVEISGVSAANVQVRSNGSSTLIDLNGNSAVVLAGVTLSASQLNLSYA